jgi:streptogramin lyase
LAAASGPVGIAAGPDGNLWVTESKTSKIARVTTAGVVTEYALPSGSAPRGIVAGPDGNLWFTENGTGKIGRITTSGAITEYTATTLNSEGIVVGSDENIWFTAKGAVGKITP